MFQEPHITNPQPPKHTITPPPYEQTRKGEGKEAERGEPTSKSNEKNV
jgi:hypothetical protein